RRDLVRPPPSHQEGLRSGIGGIGGSHPPHAVGEDGPPVLGIESVEALVTRFGRLRHHQLMSATPPSLTHFLSGRPPIRPILWFGCGGGAPATCPPRVNQGI